MAFVTSSSPASDLSPEPTVTQAHFEKKALIKAKQRNHHARWADSRELPANESKTIMMRRHLHLALALSPLTEGVAPAGKVPDLDDYQATLAQHGDFIAITDMARWTRKDPIINEYTNLLGDQEGMTVDCLDRDTAISTTNGFWTNGTQRSDVTDIVHFAVLDRIIRSLEDAGADTILSGNMSNTTEFSYPVAPAYPGITRPAVMFDLGNVDGFKHAWEYKGSVEGEGGRYKNLAFFPAADVSSLGAGAKVYAGTGGSSTLVKNTAGTVDVYTILFYAKGGFTKVPLSGKSSAFISKPLGSAGTADPLDQIGTLGWKVIGARLRTNESWLARLDTAASL